VGNYLSVRPWVVAVFACLILIPSLVLALPSPPINYLQPEKAWIKEDGMARETWGQYNDTGRNMLNLTYRHSAVNIAYVIRSSDPTDVVNATFIVYRNDSASNGFNSTGHLFPGSVPVWARTIGLSAKQTQGEYTYHLFIITYDPEGETGIYQVRINLTGSLAGGSNWTDPLGNPNVPWLFFRVPKGTSWPVSVSDQLGRFSPFFFDTPIPSTSFNATMVVSPPGNDTGTSTATVAWKATNGTTIAEGQVPVYYVGGGRWAAQGIIAADNRTFPSNYTHSYSVSVEIGPFNHSANFYIYPIYAALPPDTWLTSTPPSTVENGIVSFSWIGSDLDGSVTGYRYHMDSGTWIETRGVNRTYYGLSNGTHRFEVRALDDDGLADPSPAYFDFEVLINSPPETWIVSAPNATTSQRDVFLEWNGSDVDGYVTGYAYSLDGEPWVNTTWTNVTYRNLTSGFHTFRVLSRDDRGLEDPSPAVTNFTILPSWCERELERLRALVSSLQEELEAQEALVANLTALLEEARGNNSALSAEVEALKEQNAQLTGRVWELEDEASGLEAEIAALRAEMEGLSGNLSNCNNRSRYLAEELARMTSRLRDLNQTVLNLLREKTQLEIGRDALLTLVAQLRKRVEELQAQVPDASHPLAIIVFAYVGATTARRLGGRGT